jgi:hypothetical protein
MFGIFGFAGISLNTPDDFNDATFKEKPSFFSSAMTIFNMMFWSVPAEYNISPIISLFLDFMAIISVYLIVLIVKGDNG